MKFVDVMEDIAHGVEVVGVAILVLGLVLALARAARALTRPDADASQVYRDVRSFLGRSILLGLEVLVAADLIRTVTVDPSLESVGVLGIIVVIRTFLSFSLDVEIEGRLPWRSKAA